MHLSQLLKKTKRKHVSAGGLKAPVSFQFGLFLMASFESFHARLWLCFMPTSQPHSSTSKHSWKKINVPFPEKSGLFWRCCGFHLTNGQIFTTRGGPGKRELRLNLLVIISRALAVPLFLRRPLSVRGCKHNLAIRRCAGNVHAHATAARKFVNVNPGSVYGGQFGSSCYCWPLFSAL